MKSFCRPKADAQAVRPSFLNSQSVNASMLQVSRKTRRNSNGRLAAGESALRVALCLVLAASLLGVGLPALLGDQAAYAEETVPAAAEQVAAGDSQAGLPEDDSTATPGDTEQVYDDTSGFGEQEEAPFEEAEVAGLEGLEELEALEPLDDEIVPLATQYHNVASESDLNTALTSGNSTDTVYITVTADFTITTATAKTFQGNKHFYMTSADPANPCTITIANPTAGAYGFTVGVGFLTIDHLIIQGSTNGGSIFRVNTGTLTLDEGAVLRGQHIPAANSVDGGAIRAEDSGSTVNILPGSLIEDCISSNCGGAIAVGTNAVSTSITPMTLNISGGIIRNNQTDSNGRTKGGHGGGIWIGFNANVNITGGEINGNTARGMGGGVYLGGTNSTLVMTDVTMNGNTSLLVPTAGGSASAGFGGAVGIAGGASATALTRCTFTNNTANKAVLSETIIGGGGAVGISSAQDVYLVDCTITGNHALYSAGGGVRTGTSTGGDVYVQGTTVISGNDAATYGGGIAYDSHTALYLSGTVKVTSNTAGSTGGGISNNPSTSTTAAMPLELIDSVEVSGNTATTSGGGIYTISPTTIANSVSITNNRAVLGGGIAIGSSTAGILDSTVPLDIYGGSITNNVSSHPDHRGNHGGGIWIGFKIKTTIVNCEISGNTAYGMGGGIYLGGTTSTLTMSGVTLGGNSSILDLTVRPGEFTGSAGFGGAIGIVGGAADVMITSCTFTSNTANKGEQSSAVGGGGAIGINCAVDVHITDCTLTGNQSLFGAGGAIRTGASGGGDVYLEGTTEISGNTADTYGGGIGYDSTTAVYVSDTVQMHNNSAGECGGAIGMDPSFTTGYPLVISGGVKIYGNDAYLDGGGISTASATTISGSVEITGNTATTGNGGGIYAKAALTVNGPVKFENNEADFGGAIYGASTIAVTGAASFTGNYATSDIAPSGGAIYPASSVSNSSLALRRLRISAQANFKDNDTDAGSYLRAPSDNTHYAERILAPATAWSSSHMQGYNNLDIAYVTYTITVDNDGNGTGAASYNVSRPGAEIDLSAIPTADGYQFNHWEVVSGGAVLNDASDSNAIFAMPPANVTLKACFSPIGATSYKITVTTDGNGTDSASQITGSVGDIISIFESPNDGFQFNHWEVLSGNVILSSATDPNATFTMPSADVVLMAHFSPLDAPAYNVLVNNDGRGIADANQVGPVAVDSIVALAAHANEGYFFSYWEVVSGNIALSSNTNPNATFTMPSADVVLIAHFKTAYTVYVATDGNGVATISHESGTASTAEAQTTAFDTSPLGLNSYGIGLLDTRPLDEVSLEMAEGTIVTHTAQAKQGYVFDRWECDVEDIVMNPADLSDPMLASCWCAMPASDVHLVAYFKLAPTNPADTSETGANSSAGIPATGDSAAMLNSLSLSACLTLLAAGVFLARRLLRSRCAAKA